MLGSCLTSTRRNSAVFAYFRRTVLSRCLSSVSLFAFALFVTPPLPLNAEAPTVLAPPTEDRNPGESTFGLELYQHEIDESLDTLVPLATPHDGLLFLNPKFTLSDRLDPTIAVGIGYRHLFEGPKVILGGNLFYESDVSPADQHYNEFGFGAEVLSRWVDWRANYYLPEQNRRGINSRQTVSLSRKVTSSNQALGPQTTSESVGFAGHNLIETTNGMNETLTTSNVTDTATTHFWEQYEAGMRGVDTELGFLIPGLDKYAETRVFGGYYYFDNPFGKNVQGFKARLEIRALPAVTLDGAYYENRAIVGSNWYYGIRISTPFDIGNIARGKNPFEGFLDGFKPQQQTDEQERFAARLSENIIRNPHVSLAQSRFIDVKDKVQAVDPPSTSVSGTPFTTTTILTMGGVPITIDHVNSAATSAGDGTFEHPYLTLTLANSAAVKTNIVLLYGNSIFNGQTIGLALGQQLLGTTVANYVQTDQLGTIALPKAGKGTLMPVISNPGGTAVTVAGNNVISGLSLQNSARGISASTGVTNLLVQRSVIGNMTDVGIGLDTGTSSGTTISNVTFSNNHQDAIIDGSDTTIANTTATGASNGAFQLNNNVGTTTVSNVTVSNAGAYALQFNNATGIHNIGGLAVSGGTGFGVDIENSTGSFNFDSKSSITGTGGAALRIFGGPSDVTYAGNISQTFNAPAVAVLGGHTGTVNFENGTVSATAGQGLLFDDANGTYNFLGATTLRNGANLQILDNSAGTFTFGTGTSIVNGTNQDILDDHSTASMTYSGNITESVGTILQVNNHSTGTLQFDTGTLTATGGNGLQFNAANGTYKFLGTATLNGGAAAVDILNNSTGTFQFDTATTITNPTATAFFVNGGSANITYSGNITANSNFALEVLNHSTGTMNFNTGNINSTGGNGVQFNTDSGTYNLADVRGSNITGSAIEVDNSPNGTFNFGSVTINGTTGSAVQLNNAGAVSLTSGKIDGAGGNGIDSLNTNLTATGLTLGSTTAITGIGVNVTNNDGTERTVTVSNDNILSDGSGIVTTDGGHARELTLSLDNDIIETLNAGSDAIDVTGSALNSTIVKSMVGGSVVFHTKGGIVIGNGTGGGIFFHEVTFDASGAALTGATVNAGNWSIGQAAGLGPVQRVLGDGLHIDGSSGSLDFTVLNIYNNGGTGLLVDTKTLGTTFALFTGATSVIDTTGGAAMSIDPLTTNLIFSSVTSANSPGAGVIVNGLTSGSQITIGTTTVTGSNGSGIVVQNSNGATLYFGTTTVTGAGGNGIDLSGAGGANVTFGNTQITNAALSGINMANSSGTFGFGNTTINGTAAGQTAFNLNGSSANVTATSLNINGGGIGIDLRNTQGNTVEILKGGTIQNVAVGVQLGSGITGDFSQTANAFFTFDTTGGNNSTISGAVAIEARGLVSTASNVDGTYDFRNVTNIIGAENFEPTTGTPFFVAATALGNGSGADPHDAAAFTGIAGTPAGTFIVLVNDGSSINIGASTITLQANDHVDTFGNGRTFSAGAVPINILLSGTAQFTDPFGLGAATVTGAGTIFNTASGDLLQNFTINVNGGTAIAASGITNLSTNNLTITGTGNVFSLTNDSGNISLTNNNINVSGGQLLGVSGGNATINLAAGTGNITNSAGSGISVTGTTGGNVTINGVNVTSAISTPLTFDNNKATFNITNSTFAVNSGVTLLNVDTGVGGSTTALTFGATDTLTQTSGTIANIGAGSRNIDLSAQNFTNSGTTSANVINVTGQSGGTIAFGTVNITGFNNAAGTAINLQGTAGTDTFAGLSVTTTNGAGVNVGSVTFAPGANATINATGGPALTMSGTTISGPATFASVSDTNAGAGNSAISLTNVTGSTTFTTVNLSGTATTGINLSNAATVAVLGGTIDGSSGDAIQSLNTALTATGLTIGGSVLPTEGINVTNNDGTSRLVTLSNDNIHALDSAIVTTDGGHAGELVLVLDGNTLQTNTGGNLTLSVTGSALNSTIVQSMNADTITANGAGGGVAFNTVTFDASGAALSGTTVNAGNWNIGQGIFANQRVSGDGLDLIAPTGNVAFGTLNIFNNGGTGLLVNTKTAGTTFSLGSTGGTIDTVNGAAMNLDPLTANLTFSSVGSASSTTSGIILNTVSGTVALGNVSVSHATETGLSIVNSSAAVTATSVTINGAATGLQFGANTGGSLTVTGATTITNIAGNGINANGATGTYQFGSLSINILAATRGIDLRNSDVTFTTGNLSITGNNVAGSIGLDLSGSTNPNGANSTTPNILLATGAGQTASISGVATGVLLGDATNGSAGAYLRYGNQTPTSSGGSGSSISITAGAGGFTIDTTHLTSTSGFDQGRYEFTGVSFTGQVSFESTNTNFIFVGATSSGNDSGTDPSNTISVAQLLTLDGTPSNLNNKTIVFVNNGSINFGATTLTLGTGTTIDGFGNGATVVVPGGVQPANVIGDNFHAGGGSFTDPRGAATLTANSAVNVLTLGSGDTVQNVDFNGGNNQIIGSSTTGFTLSGVVQTSAGASAITLTNPTGTISLTNNTINQAGGSLLVLNGGSATLSFTAGTGSISNTGGSGISIKNTTGGSVTLTGLSVTGATATPLTFDNNKATFAITNSTFAVNSGVTLLNVDTGTGGSTSALTFGATDTLTQTSGEIAVIGSGLRNIDLSAQNFTNTGTTAANVISVTGQSGGTIAFGTVNITSYNNAAGTAVNLQGTAGTDTFSNLTVTTTAGAGVNVGGVTFAPGSGASISATGGAALVMNGTTISGGTETFSSVSATNAGAGNSAISLTNVIGSTTFTTVNLSGTETNGIALNKGGAVSVLGGTIDGTSADAVTSTNTTLTVTGVTIGGATAPGGNGITVANNDGTQRLVTLSNDNIKATGNGIVTTDGGHAKELTLVLNGDTLQTNTTGDLALSVTGSALNSTIVESMSGGTVTGGANSGGVLFNTVTFDASGTALSGTTVNAGNWNIGQSTSARVQGNGLTFMAPTGNLAYGTLDIFNNNGTGLFVNTKTAGTTFNLSSSGGAIDTTNGSATFLDPLAANLTFTSVKSTGAVNGVVLNTVSGTVALGAVNVSTASGIGLEIINSSATVTASSVTVNGAATGLQFGTNTGSFTVSGVTNLTGITGTGINANSATGSYTFTGNTTITFSGSGRGIDLRSSDLTAFHTGNITITGDGATAGSIALDLSGSLYPTGQPVPNNAPNISLATGAGQTAAISGVSTGVLLGDGVAGTAGAYLRYGNQTAGNSGSTIAVNSGGLTIDTTNLTTTSAFQQGRYEFTGVTFTGQSSFELANPNFIFVGSSAAGSASGVDPNDRISLATFLTNDNTTAFLTGKTIIFVNDDAGAGLTLTSTLNLGSNTTIESFGNSITVTVPSGVQPANVIGDNFHGGGGSFTDPNGAATLKAASTVNLITLGNGDTVQNIDLSTGNNQIIGTNTAGFTLTGVFQTLANASAISLTGSTGNITMFGGSISGATGPSFLINGGTSTVSYAATIGNTAGNSVEIENHIGGSVTISGPITDSGSGILVQGNTGGTITFSGTITASGSGILVQNNAGSTITFSSLGDSIHTGANQAITLSSNSGSNIDFTGGSLSITTTSATAFGATGGGTVEVTGTGNTITAGSGTALNIANTTIASAGLTFQSISAGSTTASNGVGISLVSTGTAGGLVVTGVSTIAGSGGTIQHKTGTDGSTTSGLGIYLSNTNSVSLSNMQLNDFSNYAILGSTVNGFTLTGTTINGTNGSNSSLGNPNNEGSVRFDNLTGTVAITNSTIGSDSTLGGAYNTVQIINNTGTLNMTISGSNLYNNNLSQGTNAGNKVMYFEGDNSSTMNLTVTNSNFGAIAGISSTLGARGELLQTNALDNSTMSVKVTGSTFKNWGNNLSGSAALDISGGGSGSNVTVTSDIENNTFSTGQFASGGAAINVVLVGGIGTYNGKIENNTIGTSTANSGTGQASAGAITVDISGNTPGAAPAKFLIQGNNVQQFGLAGIYLSADSGNAVLDATVFANTITNPQSQAFAGIYVNSGAINNDTNIVNVVIGSSSGSNQNTVGGSTTYVGNGGADVNLFNTGNISALGINTFINLSTNGSTGTSANQVIIDDNISVSGPFTESDTGNITIVGTLPATPP